MSDDVLADAVPVAVYHGVTREQFRNEIMPRNQPALMKGLVNDWPAVKLACQSDRAVMDYLRACDNGAGAPTMLGDPSIKGEFFYAESVTKRNFQTGLVSISKALARLVDQARLDNPYAVYVQSAPVVEFLPRFRDENRLDFAQDGTEPRIWIGNQLRVQTHYDLSDNIACCVAGKRRFVLFPPEQLANLYVGPFEHTLAGPPISMVLLENPDFERYPRFREALRHVQVAELEPGDALYMPYFWWHNVRSLEPFNILINYWWNDTNTNGDPYNAMMHALLTLRDLPPKQRDPWRVMFDYYVFGSHGDPVAHLKPEERGTLAAMAPEMREQMQRQLARGLMKDWGG